MIEETETTYGLRHKSGKFARLSGEREGIYGGEFYLTMDASLSVFRTEMLHDVLRLMKYEVHEWGTSDNQPSNRHIWKDIGDFELVAFRTKRSYDIEGGDPILTSEVVERPIIRYITGHEPQGLMFDRDLTPPRVTFEAQYKRFKNDDSDRSPFFEERYLVSEREPEPGMLYMTRQGNTLEVLAAERVMNPFEGPTYAVLFNANPNFAFDPEMEPYSPDSPEIELDEAGMRL
jgi:hypothetical protein